MITSFNNQVSHKPSVREAIIMQGVKSAPIVQMLKSKSIASYKHAWLSDRYADPKDNAQLEVSQMTEGVKPTKQKTFNNCQIITNYLDISERQKHIAQYGGDELSYQRAKRGIEHIKDIEYAILGLGNNALFDKPVDMTDTKQARMAGMFYFVPDSNRFNFDTNKDGAGDDFVEFEYEHLLQMIEPVWRVGGVDDGKFVIFLGSLLKGRVNKWLQTNKSLRVDVKDGEYNPLITKIRTDFGTVDIHLHRLFAGDKLKDKVLLGNFDESTLCFLTDTKREVVSTEKTATIERFYTDLTVEVTNADYFACGAGLK